jgi:PAS domain S-box-containing protein
MHDPNSVENTDVKNRFERITRSIPCGLYEYYLDAKGISHFPYFNEQMLDMFEVTAQELETNASIIWSLFHPDDREMVHQADVHANRTGSLFFVQTRIITRNGREKWIQISSRPTSQLIDGCVVWSGYYLDITASKIVQAKFDSLVQAMPDLVMLIDEDGRYLETNSPPYMHLFHREPLSLTGKTMHEVLPQELADSGLAMIQSVLKTDQDSHMEYPLQSLEGETFYFESRTRSLRETINGKRVTLSVIRDITASHRAQQELLEAKDKLRLIAVEESKRQERSLLMKDMHDGLGSQLTYAKMMIQNREIDQTGLHEIIQECIADLYLIIDTLNEEGSTFCNAMIDFQYRIRKRFEGDPIRIHWDLDLDQNAVLSVPQRTTLQILRILQEALSNSLRHAQARNITISATMNVDDGLLLVTLSDDGVGIPSNVRRGRGLQNMSMRAMQIGADLDIASTDGGTQIRIALKTQG